MGESASTDLRERPGRAIPGATGEPRTPADAPRLTTGLVIDGFALAFAPNVTAFVRPKSQSAND